LLAVELLGAQSVLAIHVDHGVREASEEAAQQCQANARSLGVDLVLRRLPEKLTREMSRAHGGEGGLRALRYEALEDACSSAEIQHLAVAHHADDTIETHFLAMIRGSGLTGLAGPRSARTLSAGVKLVRPLLEEPRELLAEYVAEQDSVVVVEDETNSDTRIARNRIRKSLMPILRDMAGSSAPLRRSVELLREDRAALEQLLSERLAQLGIDPTADVLDLNDADSMSGPIVVSAIRRFVAANTGGYPPNRDAVDRLTRALQEPGRTRWIDVAGLKLRVERGAIAVEDGRSETPRPCRIAIGQRARSDALGLTVEASVTEAGDLPLEEVDCVEFDLDRLGQTALEALWLRSAEPGDRFRPFGLDGSVRLFRWLAGRGVPRSARPFVPVVALNDEIIWVVPIRRGSQAPVSETTRRRLRLQVVE
jgi:tRNA(Ile)-lysidine synthase